MSVRARQSVGAREPLGVKSVVAAKKVQMPTCLRKSHSRWVRIYKTPDFAYFMLLLCASHLSEDDFWRV